MAGTREIRVYLKCERSVKVFSEDVFLKDIGSVYCMESLVMAKLNAIKIYHFSSKGNKSCVLSVLKVIELMKQCCPNIIVEVIGEIDIVIEQIQENGKVTGNQRMKAVFVSLVCFFGTAFSIMAYHNDVGIENVFREVYRVWMNREPQGINALEISYSIGLMVGMVVFFNHLGRKKITKDPTPIEVAFCKYEEDVDNAVIDRISKEGLEKEV